MKDRTRAALLVVLVVLGIGLCVGYATVDRWDQPSQSEIAGDHGAHEGETLLLFGEVASIDAEAGTVTLLLSDLEVVVSDVDPLVLDRLEPGAEIQVAGRVADGGSTVIAEGTVVDIVGTGDRLYVYGTSILGGLLAAGAFLRYWRIDVRRLRFVARRRESPGGTLAAAVTEDDGAGDAADAGGDT